MSFDTKGKPAISEKTGNGGKNGPGLLPEMSPPFPKQKTCLNPDAKVSRTFDHAHVLRGGSGPREIFESPRQDDGRFRRGQSGLGVIGRKEDVEALPRRTMAKGGNDSLGDGPVFPFIERGNGVHHHEEREEERDEVGVRDEPAIEVDGVTLGRLSHFSAEACRHDVFPLISP